MRILALGGSGAMARSALTVLTTIRTVDEIIVADLSIDTAETVAAQLRSLGQPARALALDVLDGERLRAALADADLVVNAVGPYFRFGPPVLRAAIETGTDYLDICDDPEPTLEMLELHDAAKDAGVTAIVGAGASPGLMNVFARVAAAELDEIDDVVVGWTLDNPHRNWDMLRATREARAGGTGGDAATVHFFEQFTGTVPVVQRGAIMRRRTREPLRLAIEGFGTGTGYTVGHPEPVTLPRTLGARGASVSVCMMSGSRAAALDRVAARIESGELTADAAAAQLAGDLSSPSAPDDGFDDAGDLPIYFTVLTGRRGGEPYTSFVGCVTKPESMLDGTGGPFAAAIAFVAGAEDLPSGVLPLDAVVSPGPYLDTVARLWGVDRDELYFSGTAAGTAVVV